MGYKIYYQWRLKESRMNLNFIRHILIGLLVAAIAYCFASAGAEWYIDQLKESGGMVAAESILGAKVAPWIIALFCFVGYMKIYNN